MDYHEGFHVTFSFCCCWFCPELSVGRADGRFPEQVELTVAVDFFLCWSLSGGLD